VKSILTSQMAIKWRLIAVMADQEVDNQELHELTGLHLGTIAKLRNNPPSRIDTDTLNKLCMALRCQPGDLLRYVPDSEKQKLPLPHESSFKSKSSDSQKVSTGTKTRKGSRSRKVEVA
jgi:putative transcriptional regulator